MSNEQKFWEKCGFEYRSFEVLYGGEPQPKTGWYLNGEYKSQSLPKINLDNLHEYAEKPLLKKGYVIDSESRNINTTVMIYSDIFRMEMVARGKCLDKKEAFYEALKKAYEVE